MEGSGYAGHSIRGHSYNIGTYFVWIFKPFRLSYSVFYGQLAPNDIQKNRFCLKQFWSLSVNLDGVNCK